MSDDKRNGPVRLYASGTYARNQWEGSPPDGRVFVAGTVSPGRHTEGYAAQVKAYLIEQRDKLRARLTQERERAAQS